MEPLTWFLTGMQKHSLEFRGDLLNNAMAFEGMMRFNSAKIPYEALYTAMNQISNHDHSRFLTRTNMTPGRLHTHGAAAAETGTNIGIMMEALAFQFTWCGAPTIYYGDEAGMAGWTDPDDRRPFPWGKEQGVLLDFHKELIKLRRRNPCVRTGSLEYLYLTDGIISFGRFDGTDNRVACILNNNPTDKSVPVPVWKLGAINGDAFTLALASAKSSFAVCSAEFTVKEGNVEIKMPPYSSAILTCGSCQVNIS
jgi:alpha-glucosidase